jgi:hypothetical protein
MELRGHPIFEIETVQLRQPPEEYMLRDIKPAFVEKLKQSYKVM